MNEIPESFWSLFRSYNRETYIEALLKINEEYQYNNYFLSREVCIQVIGNYFSERKYSIMKEEQETDADVLEPPATRILNWLLRTKWLRRLEDYSSGVTNIVIPDYSAVFIDAFERLSGEEEDTEVYIQNIYAILFSYKTDPRKNERLLNTALVNTKRLNKALQDMLHNMDKFFASLLEGSDNRFHIFIGRDMPCNNFSGIQINHNAEIIPFPVCFYVGDVAGPYEIGGFLVKVLPQAAGAGLVI